MSQKRPVATLWIGGKLSWLEQVSLASFVSRGDGITLYTYGDVTGVPPGVEVRDGREIIDTDDFIKYDVVLVTELSRWGRSTQDLLETLNKLAGWKVSVVAMSGMTFELETPHGRMMATMLAGIAQFERDLISERVKSGLAAARARGKKLGRQPGQRPKSDKLAPKVIAASEEGRSYRWIARELGISKNTVLDIMKRSREKSL